MTAPRTTTSAKRPLLAPKNLICLSAAVMSLGAGYLILSSGSAPSLAAVLLVLGYCVLMPLGIAL
jgi:hypothetical protein